MSYILTTNCLTIAAVADYVWTTHYTQILLLYDGYCQHTATGSPTTTAFVFRASLHASWSSTTPTVDVSGPARLDARKTTTEALHGMVPALTRKKVWGMKRVKIRREEERGEGQSGRCRRKKKEAEKKLSFVNGIELDEHVNHEILLLYKILSQISVVLFVYSM